MELVLDCSVTLPWFLEDERTEFTESLLFAAKRNEYWVPGVWNLEFANALLIAERRRRIVRLRRIEALEQIPKLMIQVDSEPSDLRTVSAIAEKHGLTAYDAAYLDLALRRNAGLATLDRDLASAASAEGLQVHAPGRTGVAQRRAVYNR